MLRFLLVASLAALVLAADVLRPASSLAGHDPPAAKGPWRLEGPMPIDASPAIFVEVDGRLYAIGGRPVTPGRKVPPFPDWTPNAMFDPSTGKWTMRAPMPSRRFHAAAGVAVGGKIYVVGGWMLHASQMQWLGSVEIYDPSTDTWTRGARMPVPRDLVSAAVIGDLIYVVGGLDHPSGREDGTLQIYDTTTDRWRTAAAMPSGDRLRTHVYETAAAVGGRVHVFGNRFLDAPAHYVYDPATDRWTPGATMPTVRKEAWAVTIGEKIFVIGGGWCDGAREGLYSGSRAIEVYDPVTDSWQAATPLPFGGGNAAAVVGGRLYWVGLMDMSYANQRRLKVLSTLRDLISAPLAEFDYAPASYGGRCSTSAPPPPRPTATPTPRPSPTPKRAPVDRDKHVLIANKAFAPRNRRVRVGTEVTWRNSDKLEHRVVSSTDLFASGTLKPRTLPNKNHPGGASGTFAFTFQSPGTYAYACAIHPAMTGTITVLP